MAGRKSAVKQYLKYILQKTLLPLCYRAGLRSPAEENLVLFADSNSDSPPESMTALIGELTRRGCICETHCLDFSKAGFGGMLRFMSRFMKRYAAARAVVVCNYFVPLHACEKRKETRAVQLWHSCGALKKFGYSSPNDISPHFKGSVSKNLDLVTVSSPECESVFKEAFRLPEGVARAVGISRTDVFFDGEFVKKAKEKLFEKYPQTRGKKLIVYMPTFRGDASHAYSEGHEEIFALREKMAEEGYFVAVRMHPRVKDGVFDLKELSANELLVCADMLITDYSSAVFEYALLDRPMLLWCPDLEEYLGERDFYLDFRRDMPCPIVTEGGRLEDAVSAELEGFKKGAYSEFTKKYMSSCDGKATERIADFIISD